MLKRILCVGAMSLGFIAAAVVSGELLSPKNPAPNCPLGQRAVPFRLAFSRSRSRISSLTPFPSSGRRSPTMTTIRHLALALLIPVCFAVSTAQAQSPESPQSKPNIVFVFMDNFGWGEPGFNGGGIIRGTPTPRMDSLAEDGLRAWAAEPGEYYNAFDGTYGGLWRRSGRPPQMLAGVGFTAQGAFNGSYYRRKCHDPAYEWIFEGVEGDTIGDFGLSGGGAAGFELDRYDPRLGSPENAVILASS